MSAVSADALAPAPGQQPAKWVDVGALEAIPVRGARVVKSIIGCIAIFRTAGEEAFAIEDRCPHKAGPLSQGIVHGTSVTCPLHNWVICLETGAALGADQGQAKIIPLKIQAGRILLDISQLPIQSAA